MTSQSESGSDHDVLPSFASGSVSQDAKACEPLMLARRRTVSRLEFQTVGEEEPPAERASVDDALSTSPPGSATENLVSLRVRLEEQADDAARLIEEANARQTAEMLREHDRTLKEKVAEERAKLANLCTVFQRERATYFAGVEGEVVKLALAIAARVLHREVKIDPLLLAGVAKVALERVAEDGAVAIRVPSGELAAWQQVFVDPHHDLQIVGDQQMSSGECVIDTRVGRVDLGVRAQLEEIERGFFDLLERRPA